MNKKSITKKHKSKYLTKQRIITEIKQTRKIRNIGGATKNDTISADEIAKYLSAHPEVISMLREQEPNLTLVPDSWIISHIKNHPDLVEKVQKAIPEEQKAAILNMIPPRESEVSPTLDNSLLQNPLSQLNSSLMTPNGISTQSLSTPNNTGSLIVEDKPTKKDIITLLKVIFRESWFQDQFLDILSKNIKTQYFNKILEVTLFNIFNNILENVNKNDNIIITISLLKNNQKYFEELFKNAVNNSSGFSDIERIYPSDDNVFRVTSKISTNFSRVMTKNFRLLLLPETNNPQSADKVSDEKSIEFENIRAKYLLDLEKEKKVLEEQDKEYKEKKNKDREEAYNKMIGQNIQAKISGNIGEENISKIMSFFNNIEGSTKNDDESAVVVNGERYNEMIIRTICDSIKEMMEKPDSTKEIVRIILNRFDYMLKEFIDIMQNNGILKMILIRIIDNYPFIFSSFQIGIENALNKKIDSVRKIQAVGETFITKEDIQNDYAFFKSIISCIIDELTKQLEIYIPSSENEEDPNTTLTAGGTSQTRKKKNMRSRLISKTSKKGSVGWFW